MERFKIKNYIKIKLEEIYFQIKIEEIDFSETGLIVKFKMDHHISSNEFEEIDEKINLDNCKAGKISQIENGFQKLDFFYFETKEKLDEYLLDLKISYENDHKKIGKNMELFTFFNEYAPGAVVWLDKGIILKEKIINFIRKIYKKNIDDFIEIETPMVLKKKLWEMTGHIPKYQDNMFMLEHYCLKPMSCPCHCLLFEKENLSVKKKSRWIFEFGKVSREESSGAIDGLKRTKFFTQDDGHIFCKLEDINEVIKKNHQMIVEIYKKFKFNFEIRIATKPKESIGDEELWIKAEDILKNSIEDFTLDEGGGAFYGPKIEYHLKDNLGRKWQCGTIQLDFFLAKNLNITFAEGDYPIIVHRAALGSIERFIAILLENTKGHMDFWLQNPQIIIFPIGENKNELINNDFFYELKEKLKKYKVLIDNSDHTLDKKIKIASDKKIPIILFIGPKEIKEKRIKIRYYQDGKYIQDIKNNQDELMDFIKKYDTEEGVE